MLGIEGFRYLREIANGSSATIYLAEQVAPPQVVALKVLRASDVAATAAFLQEQRLLASLSFPHVPRLFAVGNASGRAYAAMEYFPRGDLRRYMTPPLSPGKVLNALASVATALASVHDAGVLHCDLKPGNILLRDDSSVALSDFGLAQSLDVSLAAAAVSDQPRRIAGTPEYMSPEQGHGEALDLRSDLYSLGVILYEMLEQRRPFAAATPMQVVYQHRHAPRPTLGPQLGAGLQRWQALLDRLLAANPGERFASAAELLDEVVAMQKLTGIAPHERH